MSLSVGIVGLANVGKSTLFETLTKKQVNISNYPFCTIDPNIGIVEVPDERLEELAAIFHSAKKIPAIVNFTDIAGLVRGASKGEGLGNQFLAHIREVDAILFIVRCFENQEIIHVEKSVDPIRDIDIVNMELIFKDLETLQKRIEKAEADAKTGKKVIINELELLKNLKTALEKGILARQFVEQSKNLFDESTASGLENLKTLKEIQLLTAKPGIYILNAQPKAGPPGAENTFEVSPELVKKIKDLNSEYIVASLRDEYDSSKFTEAEKNELGLTESKLNEIIVKSYKTLDLITFFTTGPDETRAWTIRRGTKAPQASGVIHTDFENKFICADTINWEKLVEIGKSSPSTHSTSSGQADAWSLAGKQGLLRMEGKEYIVQDGDVIEVKHGQ
ncbi:MAG: redox-regulated ATPase YchF [Candidatus Pacebacteria bacterium]|nr:redox-regulated ATPase YchF [Candidatus Paceibacterota bacterium]